MIGGITEGFFSLYLRRKKGQINARVFMSGKGPNKRVNIFDDYWRNKLSRHG